MLIQETVTALPVDEVIERAVEFFQAGSWHATGLERRERTWVRFRTDVGTVLVAALPGPDGGTRVRATAARQWGMVGRFLVTLGQPSGVRSELQRRGAHRSSGALVETTTPTPERLVAA